METVINKIDKKTLLLDIFIFSAIYFLPVISHITSIPFYYIEPMRIMLLTTVLFSGRTNSYFIAITMPIFSFLFSAHPDILKALIMSLELALNVFLLFLFVNKYENKFTGVVLSVLLSKGFYYLIKYLFIYFSFMEGNLISTPLYIQLIIALAFAIIIQLNFKDKVLK